MASLGPSDDVHEESALLATWVVWLLLVPGPLSTDRATEDVGTPSPPAAVLFSRVDVLPGVLISRVYASAARDDEFIELTNAGAVPMDLSGWSLSDGEATASFPLGTRLEIGSRLVATRNSTSYAEDVLETADFTYDRGDATRMDGGILRLADAGDDVYLLDEGRSVVDAYVYGDSGYVGVAWVGPPARALGRGEVAVRATVDGFLLDRDTREDWDGLRDHRLGQSAFDPMEYSTSGSVRAILSPDDGREVLLSFLMSAGASIDASVYTLTSDGIVAALADRAHHGVRVRILLDGSPVGGLDEDERRLASGLAGAGAEVRWLLGGADVVKRYRYIHAKYAVVDRARVLISSENFGDAGFPTEGDTGNRGWSVVLEEANLARRLTQVFESDFDPRRRDSIAVEPIPTEPWPAFPYVPAWSPGPPSAPRRAQLIVAPDTALDPEGLLGLLASARDTLWIEAFYIEETWRGLPNPFLEAAFNASRRGVQVRILVDGSWWNTDESTTGNDDVVERINARASVEGLDLEARLVAPWGRVDRVHNKGVLVDGRTVFVSSMNWALASATQNREVGVVLEDPAVAATFERALREDWDGRATDAMDAFRIADPGTVAAVYVTVAVAAIISLWKLRGTAKGLKPRAPLKTRGRRRPHFRGGRREVRLLPAELVAQPGPRARGRLRNRRRRETPRGGLRGPEGD